MPTFQRNRLSSSSGLKMKTVCFSEMVVSTGCQNPEEQHHNPLLQFYIAVMLFLFFGTNESNTFIKLKVTVKIIRIKNKKLKKVKNF
jgi:hypothetical protein